MPIQQNKSNNVKDKKLLTLSRLALLLFNIALPIASLFLVRNSLTEFAVIIILISKWRMFAVRPRHWLTSLRANATDIIVKLSTLSFIVQSDTEVAQVAWAGWYIVWLILIKPRSDTFSVAFQAGTGLVLGVSSILQFSNYINEIAVLVIIFGIALTTARHFYSSYDEPLAPMMSQLWALFAMQLAWILYRWQLVYVVVPQLALLLLLLAYTLASIYDASQKEKLTPAIVRQHIVMTLFILVLVVVLSDWQGEA